MYMYMHILNSIYESNNQMYSPSGQQFSAGLMELNQKYELKNRMDFLVQSIESDFSNKRTFLNYQMGG